MSRIPPAESTSEMDHVDASPDTPHGATLWPSVGDENQPAWAQPPARLPRPRIGLPVALFFITCFTTFCAGCYHWGLAVLGEGPVFHYIATNWRDGLVFMAGLMSILLLHEMGHFLMTVHHKVRASLPFFIPMPFLMVIGTMGAVIAMDGKRANRKQLFDIGLAGPLAGLCLAIPMTVVGVMVADSFTPDPSRSYIEYGDPLFVTLLISFLRDLSPGEVLQANAIYMAGWVGMLITGLNMLPVSQLDGGHVVHAVFGRYSKFVARGFVVAAVAFIILLNAYQWVVMLLLVLFIGAEHPPSADDKIEIGTFRRVLGLVSLSIPIFCFPPFPLNF